ncbi:tRNA (adenosine(37)-N6)-threonylcarbamoyltransferase complex ATPase subunit type 1 TsaE [Angustibacter aerolatus]
MESVELVPTRAAMHDLGARLAAVLRAGDLVLLTGDLGAGKTTLAQGIGAGLGVRGPITSPTFVIARVHPSEVGGPALVHVDAYRLGSIGEVDDLDLDAGLDASVTVVEWGEGLVEDLAQDRLLVRLERRRGQRPGPDGARRRPAAATGVGGDDDPDEPDDPDDLDDVDEPREVRLTGLGGRWAGVALPETTVAR